MVNHPRSLRTRPRDTRCERLVLASSFHPTRSIAICGVIVAPMTTSDHPYPSRVTLTFQSKRGQVALDQIRAVDRQRPVRKLGSVSAKAA